MNFGEGLLIVVTVIVGFVVAVVALLAGAFFLFRWWIGRKMKSVLSQFSESEDMGRIFDAMNLNTVPTPPRVHLRRSEKIAWRDVEGVESFAAPMRAQGFENVGDFTMSEMPGVSMRVLYDPARRFYAAIYDYAPGGLCFVDLHARLANDGTLTVTNAPQGEEIEVHPSHRKIYLKGADAASLIERMNAELAGQETQASTPDAFVADFEKSYAQSMDYLLSRGGPTLEELRRGARLRGETVDEATLRATYAATQQRNAIMLEEVVREAFLEQSQLSAAHWEELRERLVIVHERHSLDAVVSKYWQLRSLGEDDDEDDDVDYEERERELKVVVQGLPPREAFPRLMAMLPVDKRATLLGSVTKPVHADLYAEPAGFEDE